MPRPSAARVGATQLMLSVCLGLVAVAGCLQDGPPPRSPEGADLVRGLVGGNAVWTGQLVYLAGGQSLDGSPPPLLAFNPENRTLWIAKRDVPSDVNGMGFDGRNLYLVQDTRERTYTPNWHLGIAPRTWNENDVLRMPAPVPFRDDYAYQWYSGGWEAHGGVQSVAGFRALGNGSTIFVVGGRSSADDQPSRQIVSYLVPFGGSPGLESGLDQLQVATMPDARMEPGLGWDGKALYVFGGRIDGRETDTILRYDPASDEVSMIPGRLPPDGGLWNMGVVWNGESFFLLGGENHGGAVDTIVAFQPTSGSPVLLDQHLEKARTKFASAWADGGAYLFGGRSSSGRAPPIEHVGLPRSERANLPPVVAFEARSYRAPDGRPELAINLYGSHDPDGHIVGFEIDWDEPEPGGTSTGGWSAYDTSFRYPRTGTYNVSITATDDRGERGMTSRTIHLDPPLQQNPCYELDQGAFVGILNLTGNCNLTNNSYLQFGGVVSETRGPLLDFDHWSDEQNAVSVTDFIWLEQDGRSIKLWHDGCPAVTVQTDIPERHVTHCLERVHDVSGGAFQPMRRPMETPISPADGAGRAIAGHYVAYRLSDDPLLVLEIGDFGLRREAWCHCVQPAGHTSPSPGGTADIRVVVNEGTFVLSFNASMLEAGTTSSGSRGSTFVDITPRMVRHDESWATQEDFEFDVVLRFDTSMPSSVRLRDYVPA
jgi:hypothetical protein